MGYFLPSLAYLRIELKCDLPIQIWHAGDELSDQNKKRLANFSNVTFHDLVDSFGGTPEEYRGYQIKAYILKATSFDEVMIVDADVFFTKNPKELFSHPKYLETGAYFFRDNAEYRFSNQHDRRGETSSKYGASNGWSHGYIESYWARRDFFLQLIDSPSEYLPPDMRFFWENVEPTDEKNLLFHYQEAGVVLIDKRSHQGGVEEILKLNHNREETYRMVLGDKETYWLGMEIAKEPYSFNEGFPWRIMGRVKPYLFKNGHFRPRFFRRKEINLSHKVDGELFWFQKKPPPLGRNPEYVDWYSMIYEPLKQDDIDKINHIAYYVNMYGSPTKYE